jgi:hypothetical protein
MAAVRICEICKEPIDSERCEGLPDTRLCGPHAEEIERYGGEFKLSSKQERTSKAGSLKINYGGVATKKTRNNAAMARLREAYEAKTRP